MRKIRIIEHISLDGVIQAPGGPDEDYDSDFNYGGWIVPHADPAAGKLIVEAHGDRFDLLLGRRTYDIWSAYWPKVSGNPFADGFNSATKHVATHRPESLTWGPAKDLGTDIVDSIRRIKSSEGPGIIVWGSSTLTPVLLEHGLMDDVLLLVYPVLLGAGKRFFAPSTPARELTLVDTKTSSSGVFLNTYRFAGPLRTGSFPKPRG